MNLPASVVLLVALGCLVSTAHAQGRAVCTITLADLSLGARLVRGHSSRANVACTGGQVPISVAPVLSPLIAGWTGVSATVSQTPTALLSFRNVDVTISGSSFSRLDGGRGGSVVSYSGGSLTVEDTTFSGCSAAGNDSAVLLVDGATLAVTGSRFLNNYSEFAGGAILATDSSIRISGSSFTNNTAEVDGGAISHQASARQPLSIVDTTFSSNAAGCRGGAVFAGRLLSVSVIGTTFTNNLVALDVSSGGSNVCTQQQYNVVGGAGGFLDRVPTATFTSSAFTGGRSAGDAGALIHNTGTESLITNCTFSRNQNVNGFVAAVEQNNIQSTSIIDSTFTRNRGANNGAVLTQECPTVLISGSTFTSNAALPGPGSGGGGSGGGGGVTLQLGCSELCTIRGNTFSDNTADQANGGGVLAQFTNNVRVTGNLFSGNSASLSGGGLAVLGAGENGTSTVLISGNNFTANTVSDPSIGSGGGVQLLQLPTATVSGNSFTGNDAARSGGGLFVQGLATSLTTVSNCSFVRNSATLAGGGGLTVLEGRTASISTCSFSRNRGNAGGAIYSDGTVTLRARDSTFSRNSATVFGGGVYAINFGNGTFSDLQFAGNSATGTGGGFYASAFDTALVATCNFTGNSAVLGGAASGSSGGAVGFNGGAFGDVEGCTFVNNTAGVNGGAVAFLGCPNGQVGGSLFSENSATAEGGGLYCSNMNSSMVVTDSQFSSNTAQTAGGGASFETVANTLLNATLFEANVAGTVGGAVSSVNGAENLAVYTCQFSGNNATTSGGALQIVGSCLPALQTAQFDGNAAGEGGAVFIGGYGRTTACRRGDSCQCSSAVLGPDTLAAFVDVQLLNNTATTGGGGAVMVDGASDVLFFNASLFANNTAAEGGGGLYLTGFSANATTSLTESLFEGNTATTYGGGVGVTKSPGARVQLLGSRVTGNSAVRGGGVDVDAGASLATTETTFRENRGALGGGGLSCTSCPRLEVLGGAFSTNEAANGGGGGVACSACARVTLDSASFNRNSGGFGGGAYLAGANSSRNAVVASNFTNNVASGGAGQGGGGGLQTSDGLTVVALSLFRNNRAAGNGGGLLLSPTCSQTAKCAFTQLDNSSFVGNTAGSAGGAIAGTGSNLPLALSCTPRDSSAPITFPTLADAPSSTDTVSIPADCKSSFAGNAADAYGAELATGPSRLEVSPSYVPRQRSNQRLPVTVIVVDDLGQQVLGTGSSTDLLVAVSSLNATFATSGQTRVAAVNGSADFTGLTVRAPTRTTAYTLRFLPSNTSVAGIGSGAGTLDVTPASLNVVIQPCITGEEAVQDLCVECAVGSYTFNSAIPCQNCPDGASCFGGATLVPQPGFWQSAANASEMHLCPRRSACRYDERTNILSKCQADWYALEADTSLNFDQLQVAQARLSCDLWTANSSDYSGYMQQQCAEGYTGNLCGSCGRDREGHRYGFYTAFQCTRCKSDGLLVFLTILGFLLQFGFILFTIFSNMATNQQRYSEHDAQPSDFIKVLVIFLQYNLIASKLPLNWPRGLLNFIGGIQIFFTSGEGIFSLDCLLQSDNSTVPLAIQRAIFNVLVPVALLVVCAIFWSLWWYVYQPFQKRRRHQSTEERVLAKAVAVGIELPAIKEADEEDGSGGSSDELDRYTSTYASTPESELSPATSGLRSAGGSGLKSIHSGDSTGKGMGRRHTPVTLQDVLKAIELEKMRSLDTSRSQLDRRQSMQKALSVELAIELERETFGQYVSRIAVVSVLVVCFFVYPTVCQAVLNTFACYKIDSGGGLYGTNQLADWGRGYWQQDMNQECYRGFHLTAVYAIGIPGAILLCLGIPTATMLTLLRIRDRLDEPRTAATYGFLYHQFKPGFFWWSFVDQLRLLLLVIIVVFGRELPPFVQLHLFIFVLLVSAAVSVMLQPHRYAGRMDLVSMSAIALIMFMSLYFIAYNKQPSSPLTNTVGAFCLVIDIAVIIFMLAMTVSRTRRHFVGYWTTFVGLLSKARNGSRNVVERAQQRRLIWMAKNMRQKHEQTTVSPHHPVGQSVKADLDA